jgi:hypothetical protein
MNTYTHINYTFNKVLKQVVLTDFKGSIEQIKYIKDLTTDTIIYDPLQFATKGGTLSTTTLTLTFDTNNVTYNNTDVLEIVLEEPFRAFQYNTTLPDPLDQEAIPLQSDNKGRLITTTGASNYINQIFTTTNIASAASYTSSVMDVLSAPAWVVSVRADQPLTITVEQYSNVAGTLLVETTTFTRNASQPLNTIIKLSGSYAKLTVTNTGGATTTQFLAEAWIGVLETLPTSLTNSGNLKCAIVEKAINIATYVASIQQAVTATTASDVFTLTGSATRIVKILNCTISATATGSAAITFNLLKRSTANTGGTSTVITAVALDSVNQGSAQAIARAYTANPTVGTQVGQIASIKKEVVTVAFAGGDYQPYQFNFDTPVVLRGINEVFALNLAVQSIAGNNISATITWTEE